LHYKKFNITVVVREVTGNGAMLIKFDKARSFISEENTEKWRLWKEKGVVLPPPPANGIEITTLGKKFAELYKLGDYEFVWIVDDHTRETITAKLQKDAKEKYKSGLMSTEESWKPISSSARMAWLNQTRKAIAMKGKGLAEKIAAIMPYVAIIIILFMGYLMWDNQNKANIEITASVAGAVNGMSAASTALAEASNKLVDKMDGRQQVAGQTIGNVTGPVRIPN